MDPALERRFQPVQVDEPTVEETVQILAGLRERYEAHHKLRYTDEALEAAAQYSSQYISDRFLPDKAIDLIDEAGSRVRLMHAQLPEEARELDKELRALLKEKDGAVRNQDFEKAGQLRDREMELKSQIESISAKQREEDEAEKESAGEAGPVVDEPEIANIVASWTGIPVTKVSSDESERLLRMEETLHGRVIGQEEAVVAISKAIRRARVGLKNPNRPIASFIFSGPTGVGKSELAKALASYYFGSEEAMIRLDMSEFMERHTVSKLIGSPPGYVGYNEGGQLTEAVRRRPYAVVLFDEVEKAHGDVFNVLLQVLDDGRITDSQGRTVSFKNAVIIMTSNVGSQHVLEPGEGGPGAAKERVMEAVQKLFRPEFVNRIDEFIVFDPLSQAQIEAIVKLQVVRVAQRLEDRKIKLQLSPGAVTHLAATGYDPVYGARPVKRAVQRQLETPLSKRLLAGDFVDEDAITVDFD